MYIKLNFTNTVSWATIFNMVRTILSYNINSVADLVGNTVTTVNPSGGNGIYSLTASGTSGTNALTLSTASTAVAVGQLVTGTNIPAGTYVTAFTSNTTAVTISRNLTGNITSGTVVFSSTNFNDLTSTTNLGLLGATSIYNPTERGYFDSVVPNSEIYRTTSAAGNAGVLPGVGFSFDTVPWSYWSPNNNYQDLVFQRSISTNINTKYYVRLRFDGLNLNLTPFKTANLNDSWITTPNATGVSFNTQPSLTNGPPTGENCIGYNMTAAWNAPLSTSGLPIGAGVVGGATSFFMYITPSSILVGGKGPSGSAGYSTTGWMTAPANRTVGMTVTNNNSPAYTPASTVLPAYTNPGSASGTTTAPSGTFTGTVAAAGVNSWTPLGWLGNAGTALTMTGINTLQSPTMLVGYQVSGGATNLNNFATVYKVEPNTTSPGTSGSYNATIYLVGSSTSSTPSQGTAGGIPFSVGTNVVATNVLTFTHPASQVNNVITDGSRTFVNATGQPAASYLNSSAGYYYYARTISTTNTFAVAPFAASTTNLWGWQNANVAITTGELGLSALRRGFYLQGASAANGSASTIQVDGYYPHNPYNDAVGLYQGAAHFGPAFVTEYAPYDATSTYSNGLINVLYNGGYQFHTTANGNPKAWYGMTAQDLLWGDPYTCAQSYKVLNIRKATPNVQQSYTTDSAHAGVYIGTDARTLERAPLGDWHVGTNTGALGTAPYPVFAAAGQAGSDRTLAPAITDLPNYKFPDTNKNPSFGLFPIVWSNSSYNMSGGKLTPGLAGFMLFNGDYTGPDDYFNYTPLNGILTTYAIWPMADGYSRRLGLAVPKA